MELSNKEVFTQIWFYPRKVFRHINETGYSNYFYLLLTVSGIVSALQRKLDKGIEQDDVIGIFVMAVIFGGLFGWIGTYVYASLISFTGRWIDGRAKTHRILRTIAYANIPFACSIFIYFIQLYFLQYDVLNTSFSENEQAVILYVLISLKTILTIWTFILCVIGIAEVQEFSILKAVLNLILPLLLFLIPLGMFYLIAMGLKWAI